MHVGVGGENKQKLMRTLRGQRHNLEHKNINKGIIFIVPRKKARDFCFLVECPVQSE